MLVAPGRPPRSDGLVSSSMNARPCSKVTCHQEAVATLTYVYSDQMVVVGPLSGVVEPHGYDLCERHASSLSVPQGWEVLRRVVLGNDI